MGRPTQTNIRSESQPRARHLAVSWPDRRCSNGKTCEHIARDSRCLEKPSENSTVRLSNRSDLFTKQVIRIGRHCAKLEIDALTQRNRIGEKN